MWNKAVEPKKVKNNIGFWIVYFIVLSFELLLNAIVIIIHLQRLKHFDLKGSDAFELRYVMRLRLKFI